MTIFEDALRTPDTLVDEVLEPSVKDLLTVIESLRNLNHAMHEDWCKLNALMNGTAVAWGWCSDYEDRLHRYTAEFKVMRLIGRNDAHELGNQRDSFPVTISAEFIEATGTTRYEVRRGQLPQR